MKIFPNGSTTGENGWLKGKLPPKNVGPAPWLLKVTTALATLFARIRLPLASNVMPLPKPPVVPELSTCTMLPAVGSSTNTIPASVLRKTCPFANGFAGPLNTAAVETEPAPLCSMVQGPTPEPLQVELSHPANTEAAPVGVSLSVTFPVELGNV